MDAEPVGNTVHVGAEHQGAAQLALADCIHIAALTAEGLSGLVLRHSEAQLSQLCFQLFRNGGFLAGGTIYGDQLQKFLIHSFVSHEDTFFLL